jgi:ribosomal protein S13
MFHHKNHHKENNLSELCSQIICEKVGFKKNSKVHELVTELKSSVNTLHEKFQHHYQPKDVEASGKRKLLTPDPLTVALVHSTKLNQIAFVLRDVLWVVCLELNRNLRVKNACSAAIQKMISLASHQEIAQVLQTTWM